MTVELTTTNVEIILGVHCFFNDIEKTALWLNTQNLNLGGVKPTDLMNKGRSEFLLKWINERLDENRPFDEETVKYKHGFYRVGSDNGGEIEGAPV